MRSIFKIVSPFELVIMEEKLSEGDIISIDAKMYIENHNNVLLQGGYYRKMGSKTKLESKAAFYAQLSS